MDPETIKNLAVLINAQLHAFLEITYTFACLYFLVACDFADVHINDEEHEPRHDGKHE